MATAAVTTENESFFRICQLLMGVGTEVMRNVFEDLHHPSTLDAVLQSNKSKLRNLPWRVLNNKMRSTLFPGGNSYGKITDFDITLLSILFRHICGLSPPVAQKGQRSWDEEPFTCDHSLAADLVRLKRYRNTICAHTTSTKMPREEFDRTWDGIAAVLIRLGGQSVKLKIDCLREAPFTELEISYSKDLEEWYKDEQQVKEKLEDISQRLEMYHQDLETQFNKLEEKFHRREQSMAFSNHIPLKSNQFTGRDKDMKYLLQTIENNQLIVITGPPGIGKTTFAIQVAHELLKDNPKYLIQFIDLRCIDSIETITAKIFQCFSKIPEDRPAQQLCNFLRLLKRAVVLLFDNSEDALTDKLKEQYFGLIKQILVNCPSVKVLCTSREKFRLLGVNSVIQVLDALENDDATSLLQSSVPHLGNENARKLANVCGCAPLALTIISYLIRDGGIDPGRLIKEIDPDSSNPIDGYRSESLPKQSQLGPVIDSSYIRLTQEQQHAFCCLSIFPSAFNIEAAEFVLDTDDINRTLAALNLRSLLSYDAALDRYSLHSYLRAFAKCKLDINSSESIVKPRFAIYYARLLKDLAIKYYSGDFQPAVYKVRLEGPNIIKMLLSITEQNELYVEFKELADKFVVRFIYMFIPTEHFVLFYSELLKAAETRGDRKTSSYCYFCQAYHFRYIADFQKATDLLKLALSLGKEEGVLDEIDVAIFQSYLAWCYGMLKDYFKAKINLKYVTNFLDKKENKRDENQDLSMAFLLNISGNSCNVTGDIKNALEFGKKALEIWRHFLSDHLEVARELYNMGIRLRKVTRSEEALSYLTQAQNIFDTVLGKCGETARNLHVMGRIHYDFQDYRKALQFLHMAAEIQETVNGCDSIEFKESYYLVQYIERQLKE